MSLVICKNIYVCSYSYLRFCSLAKTIDAAPTIFIDFIFQITFFVAVLVIDESRIQANRRDCCVCVVVPASTTPARSRCRTEEDDSEETDSDCHQLKQGKVVANDPQAELLSSPSNQKASMADRFMNWYADRLLRPGVKVFVLVAFTVFLAGCAYSASLLEQDFKVRDFVPSDSYATDFLDAIELYTNSVMRMSVFFRHVDQEDEEMQDQMLQYLDDLAALPQFSEDPMGCWVRDFRTLMDGSNEAYAEFASVFSGNLTFNKQINLALSIPEINEVYGRDIARDEDGNILASRCWISISDLDLDVVEEQVEVLAALNRVTAEQPVNSDAEVYSFFTFDLIYFIWEFYTVAADELKSTTISGVVAISVIGFLLIPHWSAILFVTPLIIVLYIDLLGTNGPFFKV